MISVEEAQSWRRNRNQWSASAPATRFGILNSWYTPSSPRSKVRIKPRARIRFIACSLLFAVIKLHMIYAFRPSVLSNVGARNNMYTLASECTASPTCHHSTSGRLYPINMKVQVTSWLTIDSSLGSVERMVTPSRTNSKRSNTSKLASKNSTEGGGKRRKYNRKLPLSPSEKALLLSRRKRNATYENMRLASLKKNQAPPSIWSFDSLFPDPVLDEKSVREDLYG